MCTVNYICLIALKKIAYMIWKIERDHTITRDQDCFTINLTTLSDLHLYIFIEWEIVLWYLCNKHINYTWNILCFVPCNIEGHMWGPRWGVANKCCTYIGVGINYWIKGIMYLNVCCVLDSYHGKWWLQLPWDKSRVVLQIEKWTPFTNSYSWLMFK